jgi:signal transduction histidine kinase
MRVKALSGLHPSVLPALVVVLMVAEQLTLRPPGMWIAITGAVLIAVAFTVRRRRPLLSVVAVAAVLGAQSPLGVSTAHTSMPILPAFWCVFLVFAVLTGARKWAGIGAVLCSIATGMLFDGGRLDVENLLHSALFGLALCVPAAVTGSHVAARQRYAQAVQERARAIEARQQAETAAALAEERLRIARELHDVIAHGVGLMGVQAGAVRRRLGPEQQLLSEMLLNVEQTGRAAIEELGHVLGVLRRASEGSERTPQPTLAQLTALVASERAAGQQVTLQVDGVAPASLGGAEVCGYRIAQEMLTNARKHAAGAPVQLRVQYAPDALRVRGRNPVLIPRQSSTSASGHGLLGMRERVQAFGGALHAEEADGWFTVEAVLPVRSAVGAA